MLLTAYTKAVVSDPKTAEKLLPNFDFACKRITPTDEYLQTYNRPNVHLVTDTIDCITERGVRTVNGDDHEFDVVIYATGFNILKGIISIKVEGKGGKCLEQVFDGKPKAYNGW